MRSLLLASILLLGVALTSVAQNRPYAHTWPSTPVTLSKVLARGVVSPNGLPSVAWFEWGEGATYTNRTPIQSLSKTAGIEHVSAEIENLSVQRLYLARLVVSNEFGPSGVWDSS